MQTLRTRSTDQAWRVGILKEAPGVIWSSNHPPRDVVAAAKDMMQAIAANLSRA
jgi:hypothetical protein